MPWVFGMSLQCLNHVIHPRAFRNVVMTMERLHISRENQSCHAASRSSGTSNRFGVGRGCRRLEPTMCPSVNSCQILYWKADMEQGIEIRFGYGLELLYKSSWRQMKIRRGWSTIFRDLEHVQWLFKSGHPPPGSVYIVSAKNYRFYSCKDKSGCFSHVCVPAAQLILFWFAQFSAESPRFSPNLFKQQHQPPPLSKIS